MTPPKACSRPLPQPEAGGARGPRPRLSRCPQPGSCQFTPTLSLLLMTRAPAIAGTARVASFRAHHPVQRSIAMQRSRPPLVRRLRSAGAEDVIPNTGVDARVVCAEGPAQRFALAQRRSAVGSGSSHRANAVGQSLLVAAKSSNQSAPVDHESVRKRGRATSRNSSQSDGHVTTVSSNFYSSVASAKSSYEGAQHRTRMPVCFPERNGMRVAEKRTLRVCCDHQATCARLRQSHRFVEPDWHSCVSKFPFAHLIVIIGASRRSLFTVADVKYW
jgi:hypothetical protein